MFNLNEQFLEDIGLGSMPEDQKRPFLQHIYGQLEQRVGENLSAGMTDSQLDEFGDIIDRKQEVVTGWIQANVPDYQAREDYAKLQEATKLPAGSPELLSEYAATKWLEVNRPDYRDVVAATLAEIKEEISANKDAILGA